MAAPKWRPWWERVDDYYGFDDTRDEFMRGATTVGFRPNNRQEAIVAQLAAGYIRNVFPSVAPYAGKQSDARNI
jgi:hypothetical protein